jgi:AraC family transcriptional activator of pyochelin receptor
LEELLESISLELDFRAIQRALRKKPLIKSSDILGDVEDVFLARHHHFRYIDDWTFLHPLDFTAGRSYRLSMMRPDLVCIQVMLNGTYTRQAKDHMSLVKSSTVQITNTPLSISDTAAGAILRGILIVIDRKYFVNHYDIDPKKIPKTYRPILLSRDGLPIPMQLPSSAGVIIPAEEILLCKYDEPVKSIYLRAKVTEILCNTAMQVGSVSSHKVGGEKTQIRTDIIAVAAEIYRREFCNPPTIEQLSSRVGINRNDLTKGFKNAYGLTPYAYLQSVRMEHAQRLLPDNTISVSEVARRVGYEGYASLSRAYREYFGRPLAARSGDHSDDEASV